MNCHTAVSTPRPYLPATADPSVRVGDREREKVIARVGQALAQGYLSLPEYEARLDQAVQATTIGALNQVLGDLPVASIARNDPARRAAKRATARRSVHVHTAAYVAASLLMICIWLSVALTAGAWYFWPVWPILGMGIGLVSHAVPVHRYLRDTGLPTTG